MLWMFHILMCPSSLQCKWSVASRSAFYTGREYLWIVFSFKVCYYSSSWCFPINILWTICLIITFTKLVAVVASRELIIHCIYAILWILLILLKQFVSGTPLKPFNRISWNFVVVKGIPCRCAYPREILIHFFFSELRPFWT